MAERRKRGTPAGRTGPGRSPGAGRTSRQRSERPSTVAVPERPRSRLTGRAAVLVLVLAVLTVSYASSMRAYLQQRSQINELKTSIAQHEANIDELEAEKRRWNDPAFVETQARQRLGYVMPGEKTYLVLDENGNPLEAQSALGDPDEAASSSEPAWWSDAWDSMELAGHPPKATKPPASEIDGTRKGTGGETSGE